MPMTTQERKISVGDLEWFYRDTALEPTPQQPAILLLHGIPAQSYTWSPILPMLAQRKWRAIAPDWPGFGYSSKPNVGSNAGSFAYSPEAFLQALENFVQALELEKLSLIVQGFLGSVGLQYAFRHPETIERLVILNTPLTPAHRLPWKLQQLGLPFVGDMLTQDPLLADRTLEGGSGFTVPDEDLDVYRRPYLTSSAAGRSLLATVRNLQLKPTLSAIETGFKTWEKPTLFLWGMGDPWLAAEPAQQLAQQLPDGEFVSLAEARHYPQEHWSEDIGVALQRFFGTAPESKGSPA